MYCVMVVAERISGDTIPIGTDLLAILHEIT